MRKINCNLHNPGIYGIWMMPVPGWRSFVGGVWSGRYCLWQIATERGLVTIELDRDIPPLKCGQGQSEEYHYEPGQDQKMRRVEPVD